MLHLVIRSLIDLSNQPKIIDDIMFLTIITTDDSTLPSQLYQQLVNDDDDEIDRLWSQYLSLFHRLAYGDRVVLDETFDLLVQLKREFKDPIINLVDGRTILQPPSMITIDNEISYLEDKKRYVSLMIPIDSIELRYEYDGKIYRKMVKSGQIVVIPPTIESMWMTREGREMLVES